MTIQSALQHIFSVWQVEKAKPFARNSLANYITTDFKNAIAASSPQQIENYKIAASAGKGAWADVPWLSILNEKITSTTSDGIYPAYLFCADGSGVYLTLALGTQNPKKQLGGKEARKRAKVISDFLHAEVADLKQWNKTGINLKSQADLALSYQYATIGWKFYPASNLPSEDDLRADLNRILDIYAQIEPLWLREFSTLAISEEVRQIAENHISDGFTRFYVNEMPQMNLPKPFLLLAGISGTGKSRFVREQAQAVDPDLNNFLSIPVRPDWHEPSDLMGYVSRINGEEYVATDFLKFIVKAWLAAVASSDQERYQLKPLADIPSYWLCLDEMNLAPVEQYFADYLSVSESRCWEDERYTCDALLKAEVLQRLSKQCQEKLALDLGGTTLMENGLWPYFLQNGIAIPPNLIVAGTVNMDETTHGFSRKVIDRAFTLDFGEFYPNDFDAFFVRNTNNKTLAFSRHSHANLSALAQVPADAEGAKSIAFFKAVNQVLLGSPFELAYRALNELLIAVICHQPASDEVLQAVWDDYLMAKLLPRLDGDRDKLRPRQVKQNMPDDASLLTELQQVLAREMKLVWAKDRLDLLRTNLQENTPLLVPCRSRKKIDWMQERLSNYGFTSFWP